MLKQGSNGNEILAILDAITNEPETEPTLEEIEFWVWHSKNWHIGSYNLMVLCAIITMFTRFLWNSSQSPV